MNHVTIFRQSDGMVMWTVSLSDPGDVALQSQALPSGLGVAPDLLADEATQHVAGRDTDTPYAAARPSLTLSATSAVADGSEAVTVTVPADAMPVEVVVDGATVETWTTAGDHGLGADAPAVVELHPAFPYLAAEVTFS